MINLFNIFTCCILVISSCTNPMGNSYDYHDNVHSKDRAFIKFTIQQMIIENRDAFVGNYDSSFVEIIDILYDQDSLKFLSLIILKRYPEKELLEVDEKYNYYYYGIAMVGYKPNYDELWRIYPFNRFIFKSNNKEEVKNGLKIQYFERLGSSTLPGSYKKYIYNLNDSEFWTGPFWRDSGGQYNFEFGLRGNKSINYPDSLMY